MARKKLTDKKVASLKVSGVTEDGKPRTRQDYWDAVVPGFAVRVTDKGQRTYILAGRFPGSPSYTRRELAQVGAISLADARTKARRWIELIGQGKDPVAEEERIASENLRQRQNTFSTAAADYIESEVIGLDPEHPRQRNAAEVKREFDRVLIPLWGAKPIAEVTEDDIKAVVDGVKKYGTVKMLASFGIKPPPRPHKRGRPATRQGRPAPGQARNLLGIVKMFFTWVRKQKKYGLTANPCSELKARDLIGARMPIDRILDDAETAAFWRATGRMGYPYGPLYRLLLLTGLRLNECADASWSEFKPEAWMIPKERMKARNEKARAHAVPLNDDMQAILGALPRFKKGNHLFSTTFGEKPAWVNDKVKRRLDARMLSSLRALAKMHGKDPAAVQIAPWTNHDLRRTLRSGLSRLRIDHDVKEAVLAHAKPGLVGTYDVYDLFAEKKDALERWAAHVRSLVTPAPDNVVRIPARA